MLRTAVASYERKLKKEISNNKKKKQRRKRKTKKDMVLNTGYGRGEKTLWEKKCPGFLLLLTYVHGFKVVVVDEVRLHELRYLWFLVEAKGS